MVAAAQLAVLAGVPLWSAVRRGQPVPLGHGGRLSHAGRVSKDGPLILVEDSTNTGYGLTQSLQLCPPGTLTAVVYANPACDVRPDFVGIWLPLPHLFEWHYPGSMFAQLTCWDMDGVLCEDCPAECDDDGPRYLDWLAAVPPRTLPRTYEALAIVTARLDRYRPQTVAWIAKHGVKYKKLIMGPWRTQADRHGKDIGRWKAEQYTAQQTAELFVESSHVQAATIHATSGKPVACNQTGQVWVTTHTKTVFSKPAP